MRNYVGPGPAPASQISSRFVLDSLPVLNMRFIASRTDMMLGEVPMDGQELNIATYAEAHARISNPVFGYPTATEANWQSDPLNRGKFVVNSSAGKFRIPDYNGKSAGSIGAPFPRGDGLKSSGDLGKIQLDEFKKHRHPQYEYDSGGGSTTIPDGSFAYDLNANYTIGYDRTALIGYAGGDETRPLNVTGCWVIKLYNSVFEASAANLAELVTDMGLLEPRIAALELIWTEASIIPTGYQRLPSGLLFQWGELVSMGGNTTQLITLPVAYTTFYKNFVSYSNDSSAGTLGESPGSVRTSLTQMSIGNGCNVAESVSWFTLGI